MKTLPRTQFGDPILRTPAKTVPATFIKTAIFREMVRRMFHTMHRAHGVGLAAPQIGEPLRIAVIQAGGERLRSGKISSLRRIIVNPKIVSHSKERVSDWEGCLSFPPARGRVPRWRSIRVEYMNEKGEKVSERHEGFAARVFQHEIDHLNGMLYVDRMADMKSLMTHAEFMKRIVG